MILASHPINATTQIPLTLFPDGPYRVAPEPAPDRTGGQKRRDRQALRIRNGLHPLSINGMRIPLHPDAPRDAARGDDRPYPRCGTCRSRELLDWHTRSYPKCAAGLRDGQNADDSPRISHGADTDVRAWWPACVSYAPREET
jgi:hypothetical protein